MKGKFQDNGFGSKRLQKVIFRDVPKEVGTVMPGDRLVSSSRTKEVQDWYTHLQRRF